MDNLFERRTNTDYYISFNTPHNKYLSLYNGILINGEKLERTSSEIKLKNDGNILYITSNSNEDINNLEIKYDISIEETYSVTCIISITVKPCYHSCSNCTLYKDDSNETFHNCIECASGYYPILDENSNCFNEKEIIDKHIPYFLDKINNVFKKCHSSCKTCDGEDENNCLSCMDETLFIYQGNCLPECPKKTFETKSKDGHKACEDCHKNCETCKEAADSSSTNCLTCSEDKIFYIEHGSVQKKSCYLINDNISKSFHNPFNNAITSCKQLFNRYIIENTNECIIRTKHEYYISNETTGLLSPCHPSCKTCSKNYTSDNTNCERCNEGFSLNGICVSSCSEGYYSHLGQCIKCHENCLSCSGGVKKDKSGNIINMQCNECKQNLPIDNSNATPLMIQNEGNCFPVIEYSQNKIRFNITEIDPEINIGTCLDFNKTIFYGEEICKPKPDKTFYVLNNNENTGVIKNCSDACDYCLGDYTSGNTNCLNCSFGYYKKENSDTNCIKESLIEHNYYKNESDNVYYKCHQNCYNCTTGFDYLMNNMNCILCNDGFYKLNGTNNCYN